MKFNIFPSINIESSDTTISRASAGRIAVEGVNVLEQGDNASMLVMNTNKLLGRNTALSGAIEEITLGTGLSFTGTTLNATGGGGLTWGTSVTGTTGTGVLLTMGNSYAVGGIGQSIVIGNTQTNAITGFKIDLGTSAQGHTGLLINAFNASTSAKGLSIDLSSTGTGNGIFINRSGTGVASSAIRVFYSGATIDATGLNGAIFASTIATPTTTAIFPFSTFDVQVSGTSQIPTSIKLQYQQAVANESAFPVESGTQLYAGVFVSSNATEGINTMAYGWRQTSALSKGIFGYNSTTSARTTDANRIIQKRTLSAAATQTDTFNLFHLKRESISNNASAVLNAQGSVLTLENVATQTAGTLTDTAVVLNLVQSNTSTGGHILFNAYSGTPTTNNTFWYDGTNFKYKDNAGTTKTITAT